MIHEKIKVTADYEKAGAIHADYQPILYSYALEESEELIYSHKRPAVVICPGGAYRFKSDREAEVVAMRYLAVGIQAFVLQYSVAPSRFPCSLLELAWSVAYVRKNADKYFVDADKVVITGFSAGGHLCACLGTLWNEPFLEQAMNGEYPVKNGEKLWKPAGMVLSYPVITMGEYTHEESRRLLLGDDFTEEQTEALSLEKRVGKETVPAFLWHTQEDPDVPVENSLEFVRELRKNRIPFELHIYEKGMHGLSLCNEMADNGVLEFPEDNSNWMEMAIRWIKRLE